MHKYSNSQYYLLQDAYFDNLHLVNSQGGVILHTNGFRLFVKNTLELDSNTFIRNHGSSQTTAGSETSGQSGAAGSAGAAGAAGYGSSYGTNGSYNPYSITTWQPTLRGGGNGANGGAPPVTAKDIEAIMAKVPAGPVQTIRVEQAPLKITTDTDNKETFKM